MIYIPNEWLKDENNMKQVHDLLRPLDRDLFDDCFDFDAATKNISDELNAIDENTVAGKLLDGTIVFGA